jgi:hypothetical protein
VTILTTLVVVAGIAAIVVGLNSGASKKVSTFTLQGSIQLPNSGTAWAGTSCSGQRGFDDITAGASVVVTDGSGTTIGVGSLGAGVRADEGCLFLFAVKDVPRGRKFYGVEVAHRAAVRFPESDARKPVRLTLG